MINQEILPAISNFKDMKIFIKSDVKYCILMDFQLAELEDIIKELKSHHKKILIHIDLIKGLKPDEYGAIYLIQKHKVDGIISIKPGPIMIAKKRHVIGIQRVFLKDSHSLERSYNIIEKIQPDYLEILPAISSNILMEIKRKTKLNIYCGGLIQTKKEIEDCLANGAIGITTSNPTLWNI